MTKLATKKFATMFMALSIFSSCVAPASATVDHERGREQANESWIVLIFDDAGTDVWGIPAFADTFDIDPNSPRSARHQ